MLHINFNKPISVDSLEFSIESSFIDIVKDGWFEDPLVVKAVMDIDKNTIYYGKGRWESPVLGVIGNDDLSGGVKTIIAACFLDSYFPLPWLGDNCAYPLQYLSEKYDMHFATTDYILDFIDGHLIYVDDWKTTVNGYYLMDEIFERDYTDALDKNLFY